MSPPVRKLNQGPVVRLSEVKCRLISFVAPSEDGFSPASLACVWREVPEVVLEKTQSSCRCVTDCTRTPAQQQHFNIFILIQYLAQSPATPPQYVY